jgi:hypothetical protein
MRRMTPRTVAACAVGALAALTLAAPASAAPGNLCAAYRYTGSQDTLCDKYSGARDVDCSEIGYQVTVVVRGVDPWALDRDGDGRGCDSGGTPTRPPVRPCPTTAKPTTPAPKPTTPSTVPTTSAPATTPPPSTAPPTTVPVDPAPLGMRLVAAVKPCTTTPATTRPDPEPSETTSPATGGGGGDAAPGLPVTGPAVPIAAGVGAVALGGLVLLMARRRRARFEA